MWSSKDKNCVCPPEKNFINANGTCVSCPKPDFWDTNAQKCLRCPSGFQIDPKTLKCVCPPSTPYLALNNTCIACLTGFDEVALDCILCVNGTIWS